MCSQVFNLHQFDCARANKSTSAWGVEARVPFLDTDFLDEAMGIDPHDKLIKKEEGRMEKYIIRKAFDTPDDPYLPDHILYRQKEQFSDGVGYSWIDTLRDQANKEVWRSSARLRTGPWSPVLPSLFFPSFHILKTTHTQTVLGLGFFLGSILLLPLSVRCTYMHMCLCIHVHQLLYGFQHGVLPLWPMDSLYPPQNLVKSDCLRSAENRTGRSRSQASTL
ncbi:unnamed protein product [Discosporangium mesarthrocarpum]